MPLGSCFGLFGRTGEGRKDAARKPPPALLGRASFMQRDADFRQESFRNRTPILARTRGPVKIRDGWGGWVLAYLVIEGKSLLIYHHDGGETAVPGRQEKPHRTADLTGATVAASRKQEVALGLLRSNQLTFMAGSEREREEWMAGLALVPGVFRRVRDYYVLGRPWGQGAVCLVRECVHKHTGQRLAMKVRLHQSRESTAHMHNELRVLQLCAKHPHPAIPTLHDFFFDIDGSIELVTDLMEGGELFDYLQQRGRLEEEEARRIFQSILEGVAYLHSLGITHRDLKPENLMYTSAPEDGGQLKIMDYDLAKANQREEWWDPDDAPFVGTTAYVAPEVLHDHRYSHAVDMWSLGVILYILLSSDMPFQGLLSALGLLGVLQGRDDYETATQVMNGRYSLRQPVWKRVSPEAKDLLSCLLEKDSRQRITAQQAQQHPWLATAQQAAAGASGGSVAAEGGDAVPAAEGEGGCAIGGATGEGGEAAAATDEGSSSGGGAAATVGDGSAVATVT